MEIQTANENPEILAKLKQTHQELMLQTEILTNRIKKNNWKAKINEKVMNHLNDFNLSIKNFEISSKLDSKSKFQLNLIVAHMKKAIETVLFENKVDLEAETINKLLDVCKIQSSIALITEAIYKNKIEKIQKPKQIEKFPNNRKKLKLSFENASEISKNFTQIIQENAEFLQAVKRNLIEITNILRPNISKTILLMNFAEKHLPKSNLKSFSEEKNNIEKEFQSVIGYVNSFFNVLDDFTENTINFEKFSEISQNDLSIHQLEPDEIDSQNNSKIFNTTEIEKNLQNSILSDKLFFSMIENEMQFDLDNIKKLRKLVEKINQEKNKIEKNSFVKHAPMNSDFIVRTVNEILEILKNTIENRESRIKSLKNFNELTPVYKTYENLEAIDSLNDIKSSISEDFDENNYKISSDIISKSFKEGFNFGNVSESTQSIEKFNNFSRTFPKITQFEDHFKLNLSNADPLQPSTLNMDSFKRTMIDLESLKQKNSEQEEKLKILIVQDSQQKKRINELILENDRLLLSTSKFNHTKKALSELLNELQIFKKAIIQENQNFKTEIQEKIKVFPAKISDFNRGSIISYKNQLDELLETNEEFRIQTEALKNAFQVEVKKINQENAEAKKLNKDLKESLVKISNKHETQNKLVNEICQILQINNFEGLVSIKNFVIAQQNFMGEVFSMFKEKNLESLINLFKTFKGENDSGRLRKLTIIMSDLEKYTGQQSFQILEFLKNKDAKAFVLLEELTKVFELNFSNLNKKLEKSIDVRFKPLEKIFFNIGRLREKFSELKMQLNIKNNLLEQMTDNICDLEDQIQQNKWNEIELNDSLHKKSKDVLSLTEELNKLKVCFELNGKKINQSTN